MPIKLLYSEKCRQFDALTAGHLCNLQMIAFCRRSVTSRTVGKGHHDDVTGGEDTSMWCDCERWTRQALVPGTTIGLRQRDVKIDHDLDMGVKIVSG